MKQFLRPLELIRNVPKVLFRTAELAEVPDFVFGDDWKCTPLVTKAILSPLAYRKYLVDLIQGNDEVELPFKMLYVLENYAKTFERDEQFKRDMCISEDIYPQMTPQDISRLRQNPFWDGSFHERGIVHPFESGIQRARKFSKNLYRNHGIDSMMLFKKERLKVLEFLERQFGRIRAASDAIVEFVKLQKRQNGNAILSPSIIHTSFNLVDYMEALILMEEYAEAFSRELTLSTKRAMRIRKGTIEYRYESMTRERAMKKCEVALRFSDRFLFNQNFQIAINDMEGQYREILEAREKLYSGDLSSTIPDIKIQTLLPIELWQIDWQLPEPEVTALTLREVWELRDQQLEQQILMAQQSGSVLPGNQEPSTLGLVGQTSHNGVPGDLQNIYQSALVAEETQGDDLTEAETDAPHEDLWELLPFHDDDDFYILAFRLDEIALQLPPQPNDDTDTADNSEYNYFADLFNNHTDDESFYSGSEDEDTWGDVVGHPRLDVNIGGSILHVFSWLGESENLL